MQALSLHLLCERRQGKASFWREYIRNLPDQVLHIACFMPVEPFSMQLRPTFLEATLGVKSASARILQAEHPLLWDAETESWLKGSPMATKLASRSKQVQNDAQALIEAGANNLSESSDPLDPLVTDHSAKWVAATLLSRAFNLEIPTQSLNGVSLASMFHQCFFVAMPCP
jgi:hypothetical protein